MRYIGNKTKLLDFIYETISEYTDIYSINKFYDLFAGTGSVSNHMRTKYNIVANDILKVLILLIKDYYKISLIYLKIYLIY